MDRLVSRLLGKGSTGDLAHKGNRSLLCSYGPIPRLTPSCARDWPGRGTSDPSLHLRFLLWHLEIAQKTSGSSVCSVG